MAIQKKSLVSKGAATTATTKGKTKAGENAKSPMKSSGLQTTAAATGMKTTMALQSLKTLKSASNV